MAIQTPAELNTTSWSNRLCKRDTDTREVHDQPYEALERLTRVNLSEEIGLVIGGGNFDGLNIPAVLIMANNKMAPFNVSGV